MSTCLTLIYKKFTKSNIIPVVSCITMKSSFVFIFVFFIQSALAQIFPGQLTCEYMNNPTVVDELHPRLSWINTTKSPIRNQYQTAYQIRVASTIEKLSQPDLWNSNKIISDQSNRIRYHGKDLASGMNCYWQVRVWDKNNTVSAWSPVANWHMGILNKAEWKAEWIGAPWQGEEFIPKPPGGPQNRTKIFPPNAPLLRKSFTINKKIKQAVVYTTGLGYFEFYTNGSKVSDDVLVPNQTNYDKRPHLYDVPGLFLPDSFRDYHVMYMAYDITNRLKQGANAIGAILGNGFYNAPKFWTASYGSPRFMAQLHIHYQDGTEDIILTDKSWKTTKSAIVSDLVYDGEVYDARLEIPDWCKAEFNDQSWVNVINRKVPFGKLIAHTAPADKVTKTYKPLKIVKLENGNLRIEFEEEISGWVRFKNIIGPSGHTIKIVFNSNSFSGENRYTFNGKLSDYAPRFNWFVFSSIEIENWPGTLNENQLMAEAVNTDIKLNADFETSNPLFNQINKIWRRSQLDNMHGGIASDCPHRERSGYTGDAQVVCQTVMHNFDAKAFYKKWLRDMLSSQIPSTGYIPNGAPWQPGCGGGVAWGAAIHIIPWEFYQQYGDREILEENYEGMTGYMRYMQTWVNDQGIMHSLRTGKDGKPLQWWNLGEWAGLDSMPPNPLVHTFFYWLCADITAKTASVLGKATEASIYRTIADNTRSAFITGFYNFQKGEYGKYGANVFALKMGVPVDQYQAVINALKKDIISDSGHFDTGIFGTRYFFEILSDHGLHDLAYQALNKTTFPSFGHWIASGSTTTREQWDNTGSHNHPMFGGGLVWLYKNLAGMRTDESTTGYKRIIFNPMPVKELKYVKYYTNTVYGKAGIEWRQNKVFSLKLSVPVGSTAEVYLPLTYGKNITESGKSINAHKIIKEDADYKVIEIGSGDWNFFIK